MQVRLVQDNDSGSENYTCLFSAVYWSLWRVICREHVVFAFLAHVFLSVSSISLQHPVTKTGRIVYSCLQQLCITNTEPFFYAAEQLSQPTESIRHQYIDL